MLPAVAFAVLGTSLFAASVGLAWKPSPSIGATGYNVYYGISGSFTNRQDAGKVLSTRIDNLELGNTYFFYATAYDVTGDESGPSEIVFHTVNPPPTAATAEPPMSPDTIAPAKDDREMEDDVDVQNEAPGPDTRPPTVIITSPQDWSTTTTDFAVGLLATDNVRVVLIELYLDGQLIGTSTAPNPFFTIRASDLPPGQHTLQVNATDAAANYGFSNVVTVRR